VLVLFLCGWVGGWGVGGGGRGQRGGSDAPSGESGTGTHRPGQHREAAAAGRLTFRWKRPRPSKRDTARRRHCTAGRLRGYKS
jgi:hypothetical protein